MPVEYPKARLSPAKDQFIVVEFKRDEVERGDLRRVYDILSGFTEPKEAAEFAEGQLIFSFPAGTTTRVRFRTFRRSAAGSFG